MPDKIHLFLGFTLILFLAAVNCQEENNNEDSIDSVLTQTNTTSIDNFIENLEKQRDTLSEQLL